MTNSINVFNEGELHADLKAWYAREGGELEVPVGGYIVDVVRDDVLIEIQTGHFSGIKEKLYALSEQYRLLLVYPIAREKWLIKRPKFGDPEAESTRRKSPKRGHLLDLYRELVSIPHLLSRPTFELEVAFTQEEELRSWDPRRGWRRHGWVVDGRRLLDVVELQRFGGPQDFASVLPEGLPARFTTADLAKALGRSRRIAQKMAYCLREMGLIEGIGHRRRSILYRRSEVGA